MLDFRICASLHFFFFVKNMDMDVTAEQRVAIKYCVRRGKTAIETLSELKEAYEERIFGQINSVKMVCIFLRNLSAVPVCAKPTGGQPCSQITEASEASSIEAAFSKKLVVKKLILKLILAILNKVQNK